VRGWVRGLAGKEAVMMGERGRGGHRIVVGVDGSAASKAALAWGIEQAGRTGAVVEPVVAWYWFPMPVQPVQDADLEALAEELLAEAIREAPRCPDVRVDPVVTLGEPARVLLGASRGADLLVVGNRGKGGLRQALLGSVSQYCVQHATCPVAVLREGSRRHDHERPIIVGVDGSPSSRAALGWAIGQASITGMAVEAIAAWTIPAYYGYSLFAEEMQSADIAGLAARMIAEAIADAGGTAAGTKVTPAVIHGDAAGVLVHASARAALLVLGNRGHSVLAQALLGSVSQRCVHYAACPVVIVQNTPRHPA
jgi:nucleotide-binding universal stress UspA family protein